MYQTQLKQKKKQLKQTKQNHSTSLMLSQQLSNTSKYKHSGGIIMLKKLFARKTKTAKKQATQTTGFDLFDAYLAAYK